MIEDIDKEGMRPRWSFVNILPEWPMFEPIRRYEEPIGYWTIGGIFAVVEIGIMFMFVDVIGFPAWLVVTIWIIGGMVMRYRLHRWWLVER